MPSPTLDDLKTPGNGQIFALNGPLTDAIHVAFTMASTVADGQNVAEIVREQRISSALECWASFEQIGKMRPDLMR